MFSVQETFRQLRRHSIRRRKLQQEKRRTQFRHNARRKLIAEVCEERVLLAFDAMEPHGVFAPGTPLDYIEEVSGGAENNNVEGFTLTSRWSTTATGGSLRPGDGEVAATRSSCRTSAAPRASPNRAHTAKSAGCGWS